jgi:hypothetical protein
MGSSRAHATARPAEIEWCVQPPLGEGGDPGAPEKAAGKSPFFLRESGDLLSGNVRNG